MTGGWRGLSGTCIERHLSTSPERRGPHWHVGGVRADPGPAPKDAVRGRVCEHLQGRTGGRTGEVGEEGGQGASLSSCRGEATAESKETPSAGVLESLACGTAAQDTHTA